MNRRTLHSLQLPSASILAVLLGFLALAQPVSAAECCRIEMEHVVFEAFEVDGKFGFRLQGGNFVLIEPRYIFATDFTADGIAAVVDEQGWAWIDRTATIRARPHVIDNGPDYFSAGLTRIVEGGKYGFMNARGDVVIAPRFAYAEPFADGHALVCDDCTAKSAGEHTVMTGIRWGVIDEHGAITVPLASSREAAAAAAGTLPSTAAE